MFVSCWHTDRMKQPTFMDKVRFIASKTKHATVAERLEIKPSLLRNWLYKDVSPSPFTIKVLSPTVNEMYRARTRKRK